MYEENNPYSQYDANGQTPQELLARLLTLQNRIASTVTSVGEAQSSIEQNAEQILLRVEKNGVISAINQSPEEISILASKINLVGAVTVLSDITGDLGTITAGNIYGINIYGGTISSNTVINVGTDARIGDNIYIGDITDTGSKTIHFNDLGYITYFSGDMSLKANSAIRLHTPSSGMLYYNNEIVATRNWVQSNAVAKFG